MCVVKAWCSIRSAACARRMFGMCALESAWDSLRSPPALEGCFGMCVLEHAWGSLRSQPALEGWSVRVCWKMRGLTACARRVLWYVCVGKCMGLACARKLVGMCAFEIAWGSLCSPHALEGCFGMCASDMVGTQNYDITAAAAAAAAKGFLIHCI